MTPLVVSVAAPGTGRTSLPMTHQQRLDLDAWKAEQLARAPRMDESTARRVSAALFGTHPTNDLARNAARPAA